MTDPQDDRDRDDPRRRAEERADRSSIVHLGVNVGVQPLADLLGGLLDASASFRRDRGDWQRVDDTSSEDDTGSSGPGHPAGDGSAETDESVEVADEHLIDTHRTEDELVVTAELPGVDEDDLSVGIDVHSNELVVAADGATIDRIELPWASTDAAKVWYNNGVLEVRLRPAEDDEAGES